MSEPSAGPRVRRRLRSVVKLVAILLGGALLLCGAAGYVIVNQLAGQVHRYPGVFSTMDERDRPPATAAMNILLVGSDSLAAGPTTGAEGTTAPGPQRSDAIMLVHIDAAYDGV